MQYGHHPHAQMVDYEYHSCVRRRLSMVEPYPGSRTWGPRTPELAAHVSLGSNRLPPDSTLLTPLPGYEPEPEQMDMGRPLRERSRERDSREYGRDKRDRAWGGRWFGTGNGITLEMDATMEGTSSTNRTLAWRFCFETDARDCCRYLPAFAQSIACRSYFLTPALATSRPPFSGAHLVSVHV